MCIRDSQWGEFESCFGLYAVRREDDEVKYLDLDALGHDAAGALRTLITSLRSGDRTLVS